MLKIILHLLLGYLCITPLCAFKLKLRKIHINKVPYAEFKTNYPHRNWFHYPSLYTSLSLSDFAEGRGPIYLKYNLDFKDDVFSATRKMRQELFMANYVRGMDKEDEVSMPDDYRFRVYFDRKVKFGTAGISLSGKMKVFTGQIKRLKVKLSHLKDHLDDLKKDNISISLDLNEKTKNYLLKIDFGEKEHYHVCLDDSTSRKPERDISVFTGTKGYAINPELFKSDGVYLVIVYAEDIKSQVIDVNFNVPLKWKTITFPKNRKMKLVPVGTEDKTP